MFGTLRSLCLALSSLPSSLISTAPPPARLVYQFPLGTLVENIACRPNSHLLLTVINAPVLYTIDPTASTPAPKVVYTFPHATGLTGIAELHDSDVFAVVAGNWSLSNFSGVAGSFSVWRVDFRSDPPKVKEIGPIPDSAGLNGLAVVQEPPGTILIADSDLGAVWAIDPNNGKANVAISDDMFAPNATFPLGINGIGTRKDDRGHALHFVNSAQGIYGSVRIDKRGFSTGKITMLATLAIPERYDDFAIDKQGNALIATHSNAVYKVSLEGDVTLYSNSPLIQDPTSSIFGRGSKKEESTLYLSTDGKAPGGGQVVALDDYPTLQRAANSRWPYAQQVALRHQGDNVLASYNDDRYKARNWGFEM